MALYWKWVAISAVYMYSAPGNILNDKISAAGIPSSGMVLRRME